MRCIVCYVNLLHQEIASGDFYFKPEFEALKPLPSEQELELAALLEATREAKKAEKKENAKALKVERHKARLLAKYGVTLEWLDSMPCGLLKAYKSQKQQARTRGIEFHMTLAEWSGVWMDSGKWQERGIGGKGYVMSRFGDIGPYAVGNVEIKTGSENAREASDIRRKNKNSAYYARWLAIKLLDEKCDESVFLEAAAQLRQLAGIEQ
jgi:hypothetical protein